MSRHSTGRALLAAAPAAVMVVILAAGCATARPPAPSTTPAAASSALDGAVVIPPRYDEDRWIVRPVTIAGDTLDLYTDSGGGMAFIVRERLGGAGPLAFAQRAPKGDSVFTSPLPAFRPGASIPAPTGGRVRTASAATFQAEFPPGLFPARDGFLGHPWYEDRVWLLDYPGRRMLLLPASRRPTPLGGATIPLGFQTDSAGRRTTSFPRLRIAVDGDSLDLLLDTGAMTRLTDAALAAVGDGRAASRGTSFIARSTFDAWRRRHPEWRVVPGAESWSGADMIEVPAVSIGGLGAGPVWFVARADANFHGYMSSMMDRRIDGALGGSALRYFRVTLDYPAARATFERPAP